MEGGFWAWFCMRTLRTRASGGTEEVGTVGRGCRADGAAERALRVPGGTGRIGASEALREVLKIRSSKKIRSGEDGRMAANREG